MKTTTDKTIEERVRSVIVSELGVDPERIVADARFIDDLGADELDFVELIMAIEDEFGFAIDDNEAERLDAVGKLIAFVKEKTTRAP